MDLFSLTSALSKGGLLRSDDQNNIVVNQDGVKIVFDCRIKTRDGWVCGVDVLPSEAQSIKYATSNVDSAMEVGMIQRNKNWKQAGKSTWHKYKGSLIRKGRTRDINEYQKALGHPSEAITHATTHAEGILLKGNIIPCEDCILGMARQANVSKKAVPWSKNEGEQLFIDISSLSTKSMGGKQH